MNKALADRKSAHTMDYEQLFSPADSSTASGGVGGQNRDKNKGKDKGKNKKRQSQPQSQAGATKRPRK